MRHEPGHPDLVRDVRELLEALNYIATLAPEFRPPPAEPQAFPMSNLFVYMMMAPAGEAAFRLERFNDALRAILGEWCMFLDGPASAAVLNEGPEGWLSQPAYARYKLEEFEIPDRSKPHWGWVSYNDFFHRQIKASARPISQPQDPKVIVSTNDGTVSQIARGVKRSDEFWLKGQPFSLVNMLAGDEEYVERFVGGDVFQSFLSGANYHRWHSPIDGVVRKVQRVEALMFSDAEVAGYDIEAGTKSLGYEASVKHPRAGVRRERGPGDRHRVRDSDRHHRDLLGELRRQRGPDGGQGPGTGSLQLRRLNAGAGVPARRRRSLHRRSARRSQAADDPGERADRDREVTGSRETGSSSALRGSPR